jgi:hypothetical protein
LNSKLQTTRGNLLSLFFLETITQIKMRITNAIAEEVAKEMVKEKRKLIESKKMELRRFVTDEYIKMIPKEVMNVFNLGYEKWINRRSTARFCGTNGLGFHTVTFLNDQYLPENNENFIPSVDASKKIVKLEAEIKVKQTQTDNLEREVFNTLKALATYKRCEIEFPEAFKILPTAKVTTALQVNISSLREKLKN